jgi:dienelactone hydrolase
MSGRSSTAGAMTRLRHAVPQWPFISPDGRAGGFVRSASRSPGHGALMGIEEGVFAGPLSGRPQRLDCGVPNVPPVLDSTGRVLLLCHDGGPNDFGRNDFGPNDFGPNGPGADFEGASRISLARLDRLGDAPVPLAELAGTVQQLLWDEPANRVLALVSEPGADTAALTSGRRPSRPRREPEVDEGAPGGQSVWSVSLATGRAAELGPAGACVWEMALAPDGSVACVCSSEPGEAGWYSAFIGRFDPATGTVRRLYSPRWQVASVTVDPGSGRLAFAEAWASDRGLVAGVVVVLAPDGRVERRIEDLPADVTWLGWDGSGRLFFAGWHDLGVAWGYLEPGGGHRAHRERGALLGAPWRPSLALSRDGQVALSCRSDETTPTEVVTLDHDGGHGVWVGSDDTEIVPDMSVIEGAWAGADGQEVHGILLVPSEPLAAAGNGGSLVVMIHGGPTLAYHHAFDPAHANRLLAEGFSVLLPNPRGSAGRGAAFAQGNFGDPGGVELEDVMAGARWAVGRGLVPPGRPAVMGSSWGGYLSAVAATARAGEISAAVVGAGISDIASCRNTCNNPPFYDIFMGGLPSDERVRELCVERSAIYMATGTVAPTLILHGEEDRCVPVSQAHELFNALRAVGAQVELAIYPREGHQVSEPDHLADYWARAVRWLSAHRS